MVIFFLFTSFPAWTDQDDNRLIAPDLPWRRSHAHGAVTATPIDSMTNRACHQDNQHLGCQGLQIGTGHLGGGTRRFWSHATEADKNPVGGILTQPAGLQHNMICSAPIQRRGITGQRGFCVARTSKPVGNQVHVLLRDKLGELKDCHQEQPYPTHWRLPYLFDSWSPYRPQWGPAELQGTGPHFHLWS